MNIFRRNNYESCFGSYEAKYKELYKWLKVAILQEGDLLEFGVASGGTTCLIAKKLKGKHLYSFDSFQGFNPDEFKASFERGAVTRVDEIVAFRGMKYSQAYVQVKLWLNGFGNRVTLHPGFFQQSLPPFLEEGKKFCFALVDCDLDTSVQYCLESIYSSMSPGAVILVDDYAGRPDKPVTAYSPGVQRVVDAFDAPCQDRGFANGLYHLHLK